MIGMLDKLPVTLKSNVLEIIGKCPESEAVFKSLIQHFQNEHETLEGNNGEPKRKRVSFGGVDIVTPQLDVPVSNALEKLQDTNIMLQLPELSVQSPFRKRLNLVFGAMKGEKKAYLALSKSLETKPELTIRTLTDDNVKFAAILNVPEKKPLRYLLVSYKENEGSIFKNDPLLIQFNSDQLQEQFGSILGGKTFVKYLTSQLSLVNFKILDYTSPDETFFVEAYKGNKEGYLYFLPNHVIFGFKKPIQIFKSVDIESITYNSITRLTFNVSLEVKVFGVTEKYEYSMIDQKEFEKINSYVSTKDVRDNSMADEHKAQKQLKNNTEAPGDLAEAAKLVPGGDQLLASAASSETSAVNGANYDDDDDEEDDDNYEVGDSDDNHSDVSEAGEEDNNVRGDDDGNGDEDEDDEDEDDNDYNGGDSDDDDDEHDLQGDLPIDTPTPSSFGDLESFGPMNENLQQELQDLQRDLDININELQKAGYF
jgi:hypothetical protein